MDQAAAHHKSKSKADAKAPVRSRQPGRNSGEQSEEVKQALQTAGSGTLIAFRLRAGSKGDRYEREADRVADGFVAARAAAEAGAPAAPRNADSPAKHPSSSRTQLNIQRACAQCEEEVQLKADEERDDPERAEECLQGFSRDFAAIRRGGEPLAGRGPFEQHLGRDFSGARIHTDRRANRLARGLGARAFTFGNHIVFAEGQYQPASAPGQHLLAHELTHVVQQGRARALQSADSGPAAPTSAEAGRAPDMQAGLLDDAGDLWDSGTSFIADTARSTGRAVVGGARAVGGAVVRGAEYVGGLAVDAYESVRDFVIAWLEEYAPGLLAFLRSDIIGTLKEKVLDGLDYLFNGFGTRIREEGLTAALRGVFGEFTGTARQIAVDLSQGNCQSLFDAVGTIAGFGERLLGPAFDDLRALLGQAGEFFGELWGKFGAPAWEAIRALAGDAWQWISDQAEWLWDQTAGIRSMASYIWDEFKRIFDLEWSAGEGSVTGWLRDKATEAWDAIKEALGPFLLPLQIAGAVFLMFTPMAPFVFIGVGVPMLWQAIGWLRENWDDLEIVITAREILHEQILPGLQAGLAIIQGFLAGAATWLREQFGVITAAVNSLLATLASVPIVRTLFSLVSRIAAAVNEALAWLGTELAALLDDLKELALQFLQFIQPLAVLLFAIINFPVMPWMLAIVLTGWAWRALPECLKPPIIDFWLRAAIDFVNAMPEFGMFGPIWPQAKVKIVEALENLQGMDTETKVEGSNRIAKMMTGEDFSWIANLARAAWRMPDHFGGQVEEELAGHDLSQPLPIERAPEDILSAEGGHSIDAAAALLDKPQLEEGDVEVDPVAFTEFSAELIQELSIPDGGEVYLGDGMPRDLASPEGMEAELAQQDQQEGSAAGEAAGLPLAEGEAAEEIPTDPEAQLEYLGNQPLEMSCDDKEKAGEPATQEEVPAAARRYGPFTPMQRLRYLLSQMGKGVGHWFDCNKHWLVPTLIAAIIVLIVLIVVTEGAVVGVLTSAMEIIAAVLIGVSLVRMTSYVAQYVSQGIAGRITDAAKALARGLAVGAIELVFALLFSLGPILKAARAGFKAARGAGRGVLAATGAGVRRGTAVTARAAAPSFEATAKVGSAVSRSVRAGRRSIRRVGGAVIRRGRIVMNGLEDGFAAGIRNLRDLRRGLSRLRFNGFSMSRRGRLFMLWGHFNPKALLASGHIADVSLSGSGVRPTRGLGVSSRSGLPGFLIGINDDAASAFVRHVQSMSVAERRALFEVMENMDDAARRAFVDFANQAASRQRFGQVLDNLVSEDAQRIIGEVSRNQSRGLAATSRSGVPDLGLIGRNFENISPRVPDMPGVTMLSDDLFEITNRASFMDEIAARYAQAGTPLHPRMRQLIDDFINRSILPGHANPVFSTHFRIPALHAEVIAVNDIFNQLARHGIDANTFDLARLQVSTRRLAPTNVGRGLRQGEHFPACPNCTGILPPEIQIISGRTP